MSNLPTISLIDYINFFTGNFFQYIGEGIHTETNEAVVLTRNSNNNFIAVPKEIFNSIAIKDDSSVLSVHKEALFVELNGSTEYMDGNSNYIIGEGAHSETKEPLLFYLNSNFDFFVSPINNIFLNSKTSKPNFI